MGVRPLIKEFPHCGPCDNFCYLGHIKKLVDDDDEEMICGKY